MATPSRPTSRTAPATVLGMSCSLRSRKIGSPIAATAATPCGPCAEKNSRPSLMPPTCGARARARARVPSRSGRSRAQKIGLVTAGTGLGGRLRGGRSALIAEAFTAAKAGLAGPGHLRATVASIRSSSTRAAMAFMARCRYSSGHITGGRSHWIDDTHVSLRGNDVSPRHRHRLPAAQASRPRARGGAGLRHERSWSIRRQATRAASCALILDVDPVALVRGQAGQPGLQQAMSAIDPMRPRRS